LKILMLTREYPPDVYGGAGVHVEYLARELARHAAVEVRTFGRQDVEPRDPQGFARDLGQGLNALLADPGLHRTMAIKGRQRAEALFSWAAVARRTLMLYQTLVDSRER
jgi:glycosyltransferase involved in cell wall biosynthesis